MGESVGQRENGDEVSAASVLDSLLRARWVLLGIVASLTVSVGLGGRIMDLRAAGLPSVDTQSAVVFVSIWAAWCGLNAWSTFRRRGDALAPNVSAARAGWHLIVDVAALTGLLAVSGAASNPFTALYFVPIALATQVSPRWAWGVGAAALLGFGALLLVGPGVPAGPHAHHFVGHLRGMWIALGVSGSVLTYFVHRMAVARARERAELAQLRRAAFEDRHITALGTLAAGAAHELATPLGTVQLIAGEVEHMSPQERHEAVQAILVAVGRCKEILARMASPELRVGALSPNDASWSIGELGAELALLSARDPNGHVEVDVSSLEQHDRHVTLPRDAVAQVMRELVTNAVQASQRAGAPRVEVGVTARDDGDGRIELWVRDTAGGIPSEDEARVHEPFFSGRAEGEGMGLGLYLAHAHVRQLGGTLRLTNEVGRGVEVKLSFGGRRAGDPAAAADQ